MRFRPSAKSPDTRRFSLAHSLFSPLLPFLSFSQFFRSFFFPSSSLFLSLISFSLLPNEKAFLRAPSYDKSTAHVRVTLKDIALKDYNSKSYRAVILIKIIPFSKYGLSKNVTRMADCTFCTIQVDSYRIGPFAGVQGETCDTMKGVSRDSLD